MTSDSSTWPPSQVILSEAEREHLQRLGGVDPRWLELRRLLRPLLTEGRLEYCRTPPQVFSSGAQLLEDLSSWLDRQTQTR